MLNGNTQESRRQAASIFGALHAAYGIRSKKSIVMTLRKRMYTESLKIILKRLTNGILDYEGESYHLANVPKQVSAIRQFGTVCILPRARNKRQSAANNRSPDPTYQTWRSHQF